MSTPTSMRAAVAEQFGPTVNVKEIDLPKPGPFQALVKPVSYTHLTLPTTPYV